MCAADPIDPDSAIFGCWGIPCCCCCLLLLPYAAALCEPPRACCDGECVMSGGAGGEGVTEERVCRGRGGVM